MPRCNFTVFGLLSRIPRNENIASTEPTDIPHTFDRRVAHGPISRISGFGLGNEGTCANPQHYSENIHNTSFLVSRFQSSPCSSTLRQQSAPRPARSSKGSSCQIISYLSWCFCSLRKAPYKPSYFQDTLAKNEYYNTASQAV